MAPSRSGSHRSSGPHGGPLVALSKRFSYALRHGPGELGLVLDAAGWVPVADVLRALQASPRDLEAVLGQTEKRRLELSEDGTRIRATHGHSVAIDLPATSDAPPEMLFHGTVARFLESIRERGLLPGSRQHVHLAETRDGATSVAARRGKPVLLLVSGPALVAAGLPLHRSSGGVWLVPHVPPALLEFPG